MEIEPIPPLPDGVVRIGTDAVLLKPTHELRWSNRTGKLQQKWVADRLTGSTLETVTQWRDVPFVDE